MVGLADLPGEVWVYLLYGFGLGFADVVAACGVCRRLRAFARDNVLEQIRFLRVRLGAMSPDKRAQMDLKRATLIILRWDLMALYPVLRQRAPKGRDAMSYVKALLRFGVSTRCPDEDQCKDRAAKFRSHRAMLLKTLGMEPQSAEDRIAEIEIANKRSLSCWRRFCVSSDDLLIKLVSALNQTQLWSLAREGWHRHSWHIHDAIRWPMPPAAHPFPEPEHTYRQAPWTPECVRRARHPLSTFEGRHAVYLGNDASPLDEIKNIDLLRTVVRELRDLGVFPEFAARYEHLLTTRRTAAQVAKDGRAAFLAEEPLDYDEYMSACAVCLGWRSQ